MPRKKGKLEFRYYEVPHDELVLALDGDAWVRPYGYDDRERPITDLHFHNLLEIGLCCCGYGSVALESEVYPYSAGTVTVIPKNFPHTTSDEGPAPTRWEYLFLDADKLIQDMYADNRRLGEKLIYRINRNACCTTEREAPRLASLAKQILEEVKRQDDFYRDSIEGLLRALLVEMARLHPDLMQERQPPAGRAKKSELVQVTRALEYVGDHFDRPLRIGDLAGACHMSETHFRRLFVKCMGMHPVDYINQVRIQMACEMLKKTNLSINEISIQCGFLSSATFNRNFRRFMGTTPNEWKKLPENYERRLANNTIAHYKGR